MQIVKSPHQIIRITQLRLHQLVQLSAARPPHLVHNTFRPLTLQPPLGNPRLKRIIQPIEDDEVVGLEHAIGAEGTHGDDMRVGYDREEHGFDGHVNDALGE